MALWLVRTGKHGEHEQRFLEEGRIYLTWNVLADDLHQQNTKPLLKDLLRKIHPGWTNAQIGASLGPIWAFTQKMERGDWIALPSKRKAAIHFGEIKGDYIYHAIADQAYHHSREVSWFATDIPRVAFDTDILAAFGAMAAICQIKRNDAEERIRKMAKNEWKPTTTGTVLQPDPDEADEVPLDLEQFARDRIAKLIQAKFTGHGMARLVDGLLQAQGYTTHRSPPGPDKGIDILAAPGPLGFGKPRLCVQVKSGGSPLDHPTLSQLIGVMQNVQAEQGLLVSWGGFKSSVEKEVANQFFKVRLWDQDDLIRELLEHYEEFDEELRAEIPLKRFWTVAATDGEAEADSD
jgi:restriction system protein